VVDAPKVSPIEPADDSRAALEQAERALRASEERLRTVVENSRDGINMLDLRTGKYVFMSAAQVELTGFTAEEIDAISADEAHERVHPDDRAISVRQQQEIAAGRDLPGPVEYRWRVKSGEYRWFSDSRRLVRGANGEPVALVGVSRDITERKRVEADLQRRQELSEALTRIGEVVHASLDPDEVVRRIVEEGARALGSESAACSERVAGGWRVVAVSGMPPGLVGALMDDDLERHAVLALDTNAPVAIEDCATDERVHRDHLARHGVRSVMVVPLVHSGAPLGAIYFNYMSAPHAFSAREIEFGGHLGATASVALSNARLFEERRRVEAALRASEARLRLLSRTAARLLTAEEPQRIIDELCREVMDHLGCQVFFNFLLDEEAGLLRLNACAGVPERELERVAQLELGSAICGCAARDRARMVVEDIRATDDPRADLVRSYGVDAYCCHPLLGEGGRVLGTLSFGATTRPRFLDEEVELMRIVADQVATALQRLEARRALGRTNEELLEADRRKNEFIAMLSHELRNPLAPIRNSLYLLDHAPAGGEQARRAKTILDRQVRQLSRLVGDLLDVTRITRDLIHLEREPIELVGLVVRTVEDHRAELDRAGLRLELDVPTGPIRIHADGSRIAQAMGNLLQNAVKFTPAGGSVRVELVAEARSALLRVADTGIGIREDMLARIFTPFVQADASLDRAKGGLGLGLALVKGLVELHGGTVVVRSEGLGHGTEVVLRLPFGDPSPREELPAPARAGEPAGE
jgi:PAS domain S-box-containing protein